MIVILLLIYLSLANNCDSATNTGASGTIGGDNNVEQKNIVSPLMLTDEQIAKIVPSFKPKNSSVLLARCDKTFAYVKYQHSSNTPIPPIVDQVANKQQENDYNNNNDDDGDQTDQTTTVTTNDNNNNINNDTTTILPTTYRYTSPLEQLIRPHDDDQATTTTNDTASRSLLSNGLLGTLRLRPKQPQPVTTVSGHYKQVMQSTTTTTTTTELKAEVKPAQVEQPSSKIISEAETKRRIQVKLQLVPLERVLPPNSEIVDCYLVDINKRPQEMDAIEAHFNRTGKTIGFEEMLTIMVECRQLQLKEIAREARLNTSSSVDHDAAEQQHSNVQLNAGGDQAVLQDNTGGSLTQTVMFGITPGTLWCGLGDRAQGYRQLGPEAEMDACCRLHDHCPIRLKPFSYDYGLNNWSVYTRSHCKCDIDLDDCLQRAQTTMAQFIRMIYFKFVGTQCIELSSSPPSPSSG